MLGPSDKLPETVVRHRLKEPPKDEQVSRLDPLVCQMPLGRAHLSQGAAPSSLTRQARRGDIRVEVAPIVWRESASRQIEDETTVRSVHIPEPRGGGHH